MAPFSKRIYVNSTITNPIDDLALKPEIRRGREMRVDPRTVGVIKQIRLLAQKHASTGKRPRRLYGRGRIVRLRSTRLQRVNTVGKPIHF